MNFSRAALFHTTLKSVSYILARIVEVSLKDVIGNVSLLSELNVERTGRFVARMQKVSLLEGVFTSDVVDGRRKLL